MKLHSIRIKNFRSFQDETIILSPYTSFVGSNGAGKSNVLAALNVFFREVDYAATDVNQLSVEDFHNRDTSIPIEITVTFDELDEAAQDDFKAYYRQNALALTATATYDAASGTAIVKQMGQRNVIKAFAVFFEGVKAGDLVPALRQTYATIKQQFVDLPTATTKDAMTQALRDYEENHPELCELVASPDNFYGFTSGTDRLNRYIQWVYVPAVRDASGENVERKNTALGKLLRYTVRSTTNFDEQLDELVAEVKEKYKALIESKQSALDDLSGSLTNRLLEWAHPGATARLQWAEDEKSSIQIQSPSVKLLAGEGGFEGELARFGNGFQRSYLLVLLQELAAAGNENAPRLILACEEPELFQHPPQAKHLAQVFQQLSEGNAQVLVTTHSPYFVLGRHFESVRVVRREAGASGSHVKMSLLDETAKLISKAKALPAVLPVSAQQAKLHQALQPQLSEMFFANKVVLVEGIEDVAYLATWLILTDQWLHCRKHGLHIVPAGKKSQLVEPIVLAKQLGIPMFVVFDSDGDQTKHLDKHEKDNKSLLSLLGGDPSKAFPSSCVLSKEFVQWPTNIGDLLQKEIGDEVYQKALTSARKKLDNPAGDFAKNPVFVGEFLCEIRSIAKTKLTLDAACDAICAFASA